MTDLLDIWAKSPRQGHAQGEPLREHTLNVLAALVKLHQRCPDLAQICRMPRLWHCLALAVALHDLGKVAPGFQARVRGNGGPIRHRHEVLSLAYLDWLLGDDPMEDRPWIAAAVASHHKDFAEIMACYNRPLPGTIAPDPLQTLVRQCGAEALDRGAELLWLEILPEVRRSGLTHPTWQPPAQPPEPGAIAEGAVRSIRAALTSWECLCDELNDCEPLEFMGTAARFVRGLILLADHAGSAGVELDLLRQWKEAGWIEQHFVPPAGKPKYQHQIAASRAPGNALLIAPTGSGKTEAAIQWAAHQYQQLPGSPPLFYVLPYKASMNAMQQRLGEQLGAQRVVLQHSSAQQALYQQLLNRENTHDDAAQLARRQHALGRLHAAPVRVLSPYQLLRAAYQLKGHEAIWTDAAGGVFVFDEIHAYHPDRLARILETLRHLVQHLGARAMVMTATLPTRIQQMLQDILPQSTVIKASDETFSQFRRHRLRLKDNPLDAPDVIGEIARRARKGDAVLVVATTVGRAQQVRAALQAELREDCYVELLHSRFTAADRAQKEARLAQNVSTRRAAERTKPAVLVATQVVEVSLDVDFDALYTDPAPLEALVQRFGRINRGRRYAERDVVVMAHLPPQSPVYCPRLVEAAIEQLRPYDRQLIDERSVQSWLDAIYNGPVGDALESQVRQASRRFVRDVLNGLKAFESCEHLQELYRQMFDGTEVLPRRMMTSYRTAIAEQPLAGHSFLVPISQRQLGWLFGQDRIERPSDHGFPGSEPLIVDAQYNADAGLQLDLTAQHDDS